MFGPARRTRVLGGGGARGAAQVYFIDGGASALKSNWAFGSECGRRGYR